jgi:hypothetical protein
VRDRARNEPGSPGRYGILARGFADGGLGLCAELTNTVWSLAGLKAITDTAARQHLDGFEPAARFGVELRAGFDAAARAEMRRHPEGFDYLHMVLKDDPLWNNSDDWSRLKPQAAQWALSQAIYPGIVFAQDDPVVKGHIALMQAATAEDVPAETGWLHNEGLWTYNAGFAAHAYLWAGVPDWARLTFRGFLNHATPLWAWREEQPLAGSLAADYVGDMPHNWASAECVLYLRHMLALEDGGTLRLLEGIGDPELAGGEPFAISGSPTRFGRIALELEPTGARRWRLKYSRGAGAAPDRVRIPASLGSGMKFAGISGASAVPRGNSVEIAPAAASWEAVWTA